MIIHQSHSLWFSLAWETVSNQERKRSTLNHLFFFFFLISFRQAGRCFTGCKSSFVFPFLSEGLFGLSKAWQSWCVNMRGYQKEMKLDCWRVCSFLWQQAAWEACHSRHLNRLGVLRPVAWSLASLNIFSAVNPYSFFCVPSVTWDPQHGPFH